MRNAAVPRTTPRSCATHAIGRLVLFRWPRSRSRLPSIVSSVATRCQYSNIGPTRTSISSGRLASRSICAGCDSSACTGGRLHVGAITLSGRRGDDQKLHNLRACIGEAVPYPRQYMHSFAWSEGDRAVIKLQRSAPLQNEEELASLGVKVTYLAAARRHALLDDT